MNHQKPDITSWIVIAISVIAVTPLAFTDFAMAWLLTKPMAPSVFVRYAWPWLLVMLPFIIFRFSRQKMGIVIAFVLTLMLIYYMPWSSRKSFLRDLYSIKPGMSIDEVKIKMKGYMKGSGVAWPPIWDEMPSKPTFESITANNSVVKWPQGEIEMPESIIYRHSNNSWFNADWGVVKFRDGKVESVEFLPD